MQLVTLKITRRWKQWLALFALCVLLLAGSPAFSGESDDGGGVLRSRVYKLRHITSEQARDLFSRLNIGKSYNTLAPDVLIVTTNIGSDLVRATEIVDVLDQTPLVQIRSLMVVSKDTPAPLPEEFFAMLGTISAGTMTDAPPRGADRPAIIDVLDNELIAIAAEDVLAQIETAIDDWKKEHPESTSEDQVAPSAEQRPEIPQEESLAQVEPKVTEKPEEVAKSNELTDPAPGITALIESAESEPQEEIEEDFLSEGLLEVLADAEQNTVPAEIKVSIEPMSAETAIVEVPEEAMSEQVDDTLRLEQEVAETNKIHEPAEESTALKAELALLRQKLAQLEAKPAEEEKPAPADTAESKVQTSKSIQTEPQIDPQLAEEELETVIDLPQEVELEALIDLVGKQLGLNYMYDPTKLKNQKVQLKLHGGKIKVKDTYALLESVLRFKGFVMTRRDQLVTILPQADIAKAEPVLRGADDPIQPGDIVVSSMFDLEHIDAASAQNTLQGMNLGTAFSSIPGTKTLIITDYAYRMGQIQRVLNMIDTPNQAKLFRFRTLNYMKPSEMVPKLQELAGQLQGVSLRINAPAAAAKTRSVTTRDPKTGRTTTKQVPIRTSTPAAAKTAQPDAVFVDTDDRTNRILIAGKPNQIDQINELIDALDVPQYDLKFVREYIIQNVEASEVIDVINELALASVSVSTQQTPSTSSRTTPTPASSRGRTATTQPTASKSTDGSEQPYISIRPATNSLLVNATEEQHKAIELVIAHVDVVQKDQRTIRQYEIQYVDTQEIMETLEDLEIIAPQTTGYDSYSRSRSDRDRSSRSSRQTTNRSPQQQGTSAEGAAPLSLPTAGGESGKELTADQPQISVLETTNSLLVYATPRQHDAIALVIAHADRQLDTSSTPYVVYALENQDPLLLAEVLTKLIQETIEEVQKTSTPTSKIQTGGATTPTAKLPTLEEQNIRVIPDEMSYSLIVYANKRNQQWISELIKELDEYRPQVLLDCTLVEILKDDSFKYDMDIIGKTYGINESGGTAMRTTQVGSLVDFSEQMYGEARSISGSFTGFFNSEMIQALLETVQKNGYGRVMARPQILVNDNQEGEIKTENTISVAQVKVNVIPGTATQISTTATDVIFNDYIAGVTLTIKPHISKGDMLRLEIALNRTDFDEKDPVEITETDTSTIPPTTITKSFPSPPDRLSTDVSTVATVPDGTTIILGGLESLRQKKTNTKVPILGDIPLIGALFRGVDNVDKQGKLYVFVKANIIRPGDQAGGLEDIKRVSKKYRDDFEEMEEKFQDLQDFPGIKPPPMHPVKVLEDDFVIEENWPVG